MFAADASSHSHLAAATLTRGINPLTARGIHPIPACDRIAIAGSGQYLVWEVFTEKNRQRAQQRRHLEPAVVYATGSQCTRPLILGSIQNKLATVVLLSGRVQIKH